MRLSSNTAIIPKNKLYFSRLITLPVLAGGWKLNGRELSTWTTDSAQLDNPTVQTSFDGQCFPSVQSCLDTIFVN